MNPSFANIFWTIWKKRIFFSDSIFILNLKQFEKYNHLRLLTRNNKNGLILFDEFFYISFI